MEKENECRVGEKSKTKKILSREEVEELKERLAIQDNISGIKHKIIVLSGKGGVGKSTVATNIAVALSLKDKNVGLIDVDVHGPSIPKMLGLEGSHMKETAEGFNPIQYSEHLKVISIGFILRDQREAIIWRAPIKHSLIRQFLRDMRWGELDYLVIDSPPGTGDEPLSVVQLIENADGGIIITTPQDVAVSDVKKAITFCRRVNLPIIGVIENMSGFVCPNCGQTIDIFKRGGGEDMAVEMGVPFLGRIPLEPKIVETGDNGKPYLQYYRDSETARAFELAIQPLLHLRDKRLKE